MTGTKTKALTGVNVKTLEGVNTRQSMSKTVSFRCSGELDEFLEREAERRMTTKSTVAQMIVADYAAKKKYDPDTEMEPSIPPELEKRESEDETGE